MQEDIVRPPVETVATVSRGVTAQRLWHCVEEASVGVIMHDVSLQRGKETLENCHSEKPPASTWGGRLQIANPQGETH